MSAELPMTLAAVDAPRAHSFQKFASTALSATARFWFIVTILGQSLFAFTIASYYGLTAARGDLQAWGRFMSRGWTPGDTAGNLAVVAHLFSAVVMILAGAFQFVPRIRARWPAIHRWSGRTYMLTAVMLSAAGLYMTWIRGSIGDMSLHVASTINAILIWICAAVALRYAIARDFRNHGRWALRLFLVVSAAWFFRAGFFLSLVLFQGPWGFDPNTFTGPFITFMAYAQYLFPLAVAELYFRARDRPGVIRRAAMATGLLVLTLATAAGVLAVSAFVWVPSLKAAFDRRISIARTLATTIESSGIDAALRRYRDLKSADASIYNFDEEQLNTLGYELLRAKKTDEAIRIFQLNVEAYPQSANTWDSLGEGYMRDGNRAEAVKNDRKSLQLNPNNRNAAAALQKLDAKGE
jgi:uncharacterized membrane protein